MNRSVFSLFFLFAMLRAAAPAAPEPTVAVFPDRPGIARAVRAGEEGGARTFDLRDAFRLGAESVRLSFPVPEPERFAGRDIAFVATLHTDSEGAAPKVAAVPGGRRGGAVWRSQGRHWPAVVELGREAVRIESSCLVPGDAAELFLDLECTAPGDGRIFVDDVQTGGFEILSSDPPEPAAEPPARYADSMTPVAAVLGRDPSKRATVPPPWNVADWGWNAPWRDPPETPPPNPARLPSGGACGVPSGMRLLDDVDPAALALSADTNRFASTGTWKTGVLGGVRFLDAGDGVGDRYAVRFPILDDSPLLCFEIDYPDDRARTADFTVFASADPKNDFALQAGVETGLEHPLSGGIATKRFLYWPRETAATADGRRDLTLVVMTRGAGESAAVARVRVFAIDSGALPPVAPPAAQEEPDAAPRRRFALRYEDPAATWDFGAGLGTAESAKRAIDRLCAYMAFAGADTLVYPAVWYPGPICDRYKPRVHVPHYLREICRRFERDGLGLFASVNQHRFPGLEGALVRRSLVDGSLHDSPISVLDTGAPNWGGWHFTPPYYNIAHPAVQDAFEKEIDAILDECAGHRSFQGVYFDLFNSQNAAWWGCLEAGYNDYAVKDFCRDRGFALPGGPDFVSPLRGRAYAAWIRADPARLEAWIDWRCETLARFYGRIAARVAARRPDLRLWIGASPPWRPRLAARPDLRDPGVVARSLREAGIDGARLAAIPGLALGVLTMPCWYRDELRATKGVPEEDLVFVRDLPETPGAYAPARETDFPLAVLHDSYYETAVGAPPGTGRKSGDGRLRAPWLVEPAWRVTAFNASGREALRPYAKALEHGDLLAFAKGGFLLGTLGTEDVLAPFMRAFRALPAVAFEDEPLPGLPPSARFRSATVGATRWYYALNAGSGPCRVAPPPGLLDAVTGEPLPAEIELDAYELRALRGRF